MLRLDLKLPRIFLLALVFALLVAVSGCGGGNEPTAPEYAPSPSERAEMDLKATQALIQKYQVSASLGLESLAISPQKQDTFLFENTCFSILRNHDFLENAPQRSDYLPIIFNRYGAAPIRTMGNYVYAVYETDAGTRVYLYFRRSNDYSHLGGYVILMNRALYQSDFIGLQKGDTMADVLRVDPNAALYLQAYDAEEATWLLNPDSSGWQITTTHLL
ncbi:MAG: hypothetical protein LBS96_07720, partial [Oscillospiraceae bacterium]|nr:hypothetical protein [Oscillospiraceae bacterium]